MNIYQCINVSNVIWYIQKFVWFMFYHDKLYQTMVFVFRFFSSFFLFFLVVEIYTCCNTYATNDKEKGKQYKILFSLKKISARTLEKRKISCKLVLFKKNIYVHKHKRELKDFWFSLSLSFPHSLSMPKLVQWEMV